MELSRARAFLHILCALVGALALCTKARSSIESRLFDSFVSNYTRSYRNDPGTMDRKFRAFQQSLDRQKILNEYERENGGTAVYGINRFSDLTPEEFKGMYLSPPTKFPSSTHSSFEDKVSESEEGVEERFDWRDQGVIGPIRDQERCGSCWAFAVVETIESAYAIEQKQKVEIILSSQQVLSCDEDPNLHGCEGGALEPAFSSLKDLKMVIVEQSVYPFKSKDGSDFPCATNLPNSGLILMNYTYQIGVDANTMKSLLHVSPLTISINAVAWQDYIGGIIQHHCDDDYADHAVQVVGYDLSGDVPYWIVRNTWGKTWGEGGYAKVLYGANMCGIRKEIVAVVDVKRI